jgi:hypothetical protein
VYEQRKETLIRLCRRARQQPSYGVTKGRRCRQSAPPTLSVAGEVGQRVRKVSIPTKQRIVHRLEDAQHVGDAGNSQRAGERLTQIG